MPNIQVPQNLLKKHCDVVIKFYLLSITKTISMEMRWKNTRHDSGICDLVFACVQKTLETCLKSNVWDNSFRKCDDDCVMFILVFTCVMVILGKAYNVTC